MKSATDFDRLAACQTPGEMTVFINQAKEALSAPAGPR